MTSFRQIAANRRWLLDVGVEGRTNSQSGITFELIIFLMPHLDGEAECQIRLRWGCHFHPNDPDERKDAWIALQTRQFGVFRKRLTAVRRCDFWV